MVWIGRQLSVEDFGISVATPQEKLDLMPCTARCPGFCQPQLHGRKISGHSTASFRLLLAWSRRCGPSLTWSGRRWPRAPDCRWNSSTQWRFGGCRLSFLRDPVRLSGSSRSQDRRLEGNSFATHHSRRTTFEVQSQHQGVQAQHYWGSSHPPRGRAALVARYTGLGSRQVSVIVSAQKHGAALQQVRRPQRAWELALDTVLGLYSVGLATPVCPQPHLAPQPLERVCQGSRLQIGIVGSGRPPLQSTVRRTGKRGAPKHREFGAFLLVALLTPRVVGPSRLPGPAHCMPPGRTSVHSPPVRPGRVTLLSEGFCITYHRSCLPPRVQTFGGSASTQLRHP